ncbi:MAG: hypothetical protein AAB116_24525, partial [Candidatus Poribacteria bacterium]
SDVQNERHRKFRNCNEIFDFIGEGLIEAKLIPLDPNVIVQNNSNQNNECSKEPVSDPKHPDKQTKGGFPPPYGDSCDVSCPTPQAYDKTDSSSGKAK